MSQEITSSKKYNKWIVILSVAIPLLVAVLFTVKIPNATPLTFLPPIYASINGLTALLLVSALIAIKNKKRRTTTAVQEAGYRRMVSSS